jgi:hypothetical protein
MAVEVKTEALLETEREGYNPDIEFLPWYVVNNSMLRCEGDEGCGSLLMSDDVDRHLAWHRKVYPRVQVEVHVSPAQDPATVADAVVSSIGLRKQR